MLTPREAIRYLEGLGLLDAEAIVDGYIQIADVSRRNCNYRIVVDGGPSYFLKQASHSDKVASLTNEAAIYQLIGANFTAKKSNARYMPGLVAHDVNENILILEHIQRCRDLREHHSRIRRLSPSLAARMGKALATLHRYDYNTIDVTKGGIRPVEPPGVLSLHRPTPITLRSLSGTNIHVVAILQQFPSFGHELDRLRDEWSTEALIHCDIKWDNWLILARGHDAGGSGLKIVDWELAGIGDPCWDIGSVLTDHLGFWLDSIPASGETPTGALSGSARYPMEGMQASVRSFWRSYVRHTDVSSTHSDEWILRATRYAAAQLVLATLARLESAMQMNRRAVFHLQLAQNILQRPDEALVSVLGIPYKGRGPR
jgi:thiamine kinase-like enzyme